MKTKKNRSGFIAKLIVIISLVLSVFVGGFFFLDKIIVPKYFGDYGIYNVGDLIGVVSSLYSSPKENEIVTNGHSPIDLKNAIAKLREAEYKIQEDGTILKEDIDSFKGNGRVELTDCEFASICDKLIENGMLKNALPDLNYLNVMNISVLELTSTPVEDSLDEETNTYSKAHIKFIVKIETSDIRDQIAAQMQTPMYLLKIIIPDKLYFSINYDIDLDNQDERYSNGDISINGRTAKQSETLINLLIEFIFPEEDNMDINSFTKAIGDVAMKGIDALGTFRFVSGIGVSHQRNGFVVN